MWKLVLAETCHNVAWEHEPKSPRGHIIPYKKDGNHGWQPWKLKLHKLKGITSHFASWCREMTSNLNQMKSKRDDSSHWFRIRVTENGTRLDPKVVLLNLCILDPNSTGQNKKNCIVKAHYARICAQCSMHFTWRKRYNWYDRCQNCANRKWSLSSRWSKKSDGTWFQKQKGKRRGQGQMTNPEIKISGISLTGRLRNAWQLENKSRHNK